MDNICLECHKVFTRKDNLTRHVRTCHVGPSGNLSSSNTAQKASTTHSKRMSSGNKDDEQRKVQKVSTSSSSTSVDTPTSSSSGNRNAELRFCDICSIDVSLHYWVAHLRSNRHKAFHWKPSEINGVEIIQSGFKCRIISYKLQSSNYHINLRDFFK